MAQRRSDKIVVHLEPILYKAVESLFNKEGKTASAFMRDVVIRDLKDRGLLSQEMLESLL